MIAAAVVLFAVGLADLVRPHDRRPAPFVMARAGVLGATGALLLVWGMGVAWWFLPVTLLVLAGWLSSTPAPARIPAVVPALALAGVIGACLSAPALRTDTNAWLVRWFEGLDLPAVQGVPFASFVLGSACAVFLVNSANLVVRITLTLADDRVAATEEQLRGGRILGPLERWFVFFMALAGYYAALAAVVAAKGILRFPEISRHDPDGNKAEYVLVGSFVSWSLAFVFVPLF